MWTIFGPCVETAALPCALPVTPTWFRLVLRKTGSSPPFDATIIDGHIVGRGAADMKGSLAAMIVAVEQFVGEHPQHNGRIAFLITSDEEGIAVNGTVKVVEWLPTAKPIA